MTASVTKCQNRFTYHLRDLRLYLYRDTQESSRSMPPIHLLYSETIKGLSISMHAPLPLFQRLPIFCWCGFSIRGHESKSSCVQPTQTDHILIAPNFEINWPSPFS